MTSFSLGPPQPEGYSPPLIPAHEHPVELWQLNWGPAVTIADLGLWLDAVAKGLTAILRNQAAERRLLDLLSRALPTISGKEDLLMLNTQELIDVVSTVADDVQQAQADQLVVVNGLDDLRRQLGDNVAAQNTLDALATKLAGAHDTLAGVHTTLRSAVAQDDPATSDPVPPPSSTGGSDQPTPATSSGDGTTSGSGTAPDGSSGTPTDGGTTPTELPLYVYSGDSSLGSVDTSAWTRAGSTPDGRSLYTYAGDSPGGAPTGATADWTPYTPSA